jgi:hypothetical protein
MSEEKTLTSILNNRHFAQFAAILSVAQSSSWRRSHPDIPVLSSIERMVKLLRGGEGFPPELRREFLAIWSILLSQIVMAGPRLFYTEEDMHWLIDVLDGEASGAKMILMMLFAYASAKQSYISAEQVAEITGEGASTWRNRASAGKIVGARKIGKTWLFSTTALRAYGIEVSDEIERGEPEESPDDDMIE